MAWTPVPKSLASAVVNIWHAPITTVVWRVLLLAIAAFLIAWFFATANYWGLFILATLMAIALLVLLRDVFADAWNANFYRL